MNKICAVIPAYNEEKNLGLILKKVKAHSIDIIVIDDGSIDQTATIAEREGAHLIRHPINKGKGDAIRNGFQLALEKGYDIIISLDADGQHDPGEIPHFIEKINNSNVGMVVGNRLHSPAGMPSSRLFVNRLFSKITSKLLKQYIPDALCGYKIIKAEVLNSIKLNTNKYDTDPEIIIKAVKGGFKIDFINIKCIYAGETSYIKPANYITNFFRLIIREIKNN